MQAGTQILLTHTVTGCVLACPDGLDAFPPTDLITSALKDSSNEKVCCL